MRIHLGFILLAASIAQAGLQWEQTEVKLDVHATQTAADAVFRFSNNGTEPVSLADVRVTCGCLFSDLKQKSYAPGESGELTIEFNLNNRTGNQRKAVLATTAAGESTKLFIEVDIPEAFIITPRLMQWKKDSDELVKTARLINPNNYPIQLPAILSSNPDLPAELIVIREGFEYEVAVSRKSAERNSRAVVRIETGPPPGETTSKTLKLYAHVQ